MIGNDDIRTIGGRNVVGSNGEKIGKAGTVYLDDETGAPEWVTVSTGLFGTKESFVPLAEASVAGDDLQVPYDKDMIKNAPAVDADQHLSQQEEGQLYRYYNLSYTERESGSGLPDEYGTGGRTTGVVEETRGTVGHDTSGPTTDDAMTRSEERLRVGTERVESGRARLRKYVVTENVTQTVPVSREEVRIEREPITEANIGDATSGPDISEEEHEVILHEERPVVAKETVPVERVRLGKETVTEQQTVTEQVRKEQIDTEGVDVTEGRTYDDGDTRR